MSRRNAVIQSPILHAILAACLFILPGSGGQAFDGLRHDFTWNASLSLTGFALRNEPIRDETLQNDSGGCMSYKLGFSYRYRDVAGIDLDLHAEGQSEYGLLLGSSRETLYGKLDAMTGSDLVPFVDNLALWIREPGYGLTLRAGLIRPFDWTKYANPGILASFDQPPFALSVSVSDIGKRSGWYRHPKKLAETREIPDALDAQYYTVDARLHWRNFQVRLAGELFRDNTPAADRWNPWIDEFGVIDHDSLGTWIAGVEGRFRGLSGFGEFSRNFGNGEGSEDSGSYHMDYSGSRTEAWIGYDYGAISGKIRYLDASGQPDESDDAHHTEFKGFALYPPTDLAFYDSHFRKEDTPPVYTGGAVTPYYGVRHPSHYLDAYVLENLKLFQTSLILSPVNALRIRLDGWIIRMDTPERYPKPGGGTAVCSCDLGREIDGEISWQLMDNLSVRVFHGIFTTGRFYHDVQPYTSDQSPYDGLDGVTVSLTEIGVSAWY